MDKHQLRGPHGSVKVDSLEHLVSGDEYGLEGVEGGVVEGEMPFDYVERVDDTIDVHFPVLNAGEVGIAKQIVHYVRAVAARDDLVHVRRLGRVFSDAKFRHLLRSEAVL